MIWQSVRLSSQFYWPNEVSADIVCYDHDTGDHEERRALGTQLIRGEARGHPLPPWQGLKGEEEEEVVVVWVMERGNKRGGS